MGGDEDSAEAPEGPVPGGPGPGPDGRTGAVDASSVDGLPDVLVIDSPAALRAMASPVRFSAVSELFESQRPRTATELAASCAVSPSAMSYHLRSLEEHGIVRRAPTAADGRERPWVAMARSWVLDTGAETTGTAQGRLVDVYLEPVRTRAKRLLAERSRDPERLPRSTFTALATGELRLTATQLDALGAELARVVASYQQASERSADDADGDAAGDGRQPRVRARYLWSVVPEEPETVDARGSVDGP